MKTSILQEVVLRASPFQNDVRSTPGTLSSGDFVRYFRNNFQTISPIAARKAAMAWVDIVEVDDGEDLDLMWMKDWDGCREAGLHPPRIYTLGSPDAPSSRRHLLLS